MQAAEELRREIRALSVARRAMSLGASQDVRELCEALVRVMELRPEIWKDFGWGIIHVRQGDDFRALK